MLYREMKIGDYLSKDKNRLNQEITDLNEKFLTLDKGYTDCSKRLSSIKRPEPPAYTIDPDLGEQNNQYIKNMTETYESELKKYYEDPRVKALQVELKEISTERKKIFYQLSECKQHLKDIENPDIKLITLEQEDEEDSLNEYFKKKMLKYLSLI